ncbi:hemerythrin domain-containing protein [Nonomuraea phyllanthi]|uniref:hemerythrin domain-containing protein n=1 Tax=Nonomuraea phyllanthi TaxID=2219224 RepID=UPI001293FC37|nr:hemerythrin domain-containing protein [Nonomuraea phyllanthi]QFY13137.1 hemerythrin domain-containing protein [Nonomuraea phyllanthi]
METPDGRLTAFGNQLIDVHIWLREQLDVLREHLDGGGGPLRGGTRLHDLRAHCLTFCSALSRHHSGEDGGAFPALAERFPELGPVLDELRRDHVLVEDSLRRLRELIEGLDEGGDLARARTELDSLAALMETHFVYEEKRIVAALNGLDVPEWHRTRPGFLINGDSEG